MTDKNQIMSIMEQIRAAAKNLSKDIDQHDSREKTQEDLEELTLSFQDLKELFSALNPKDSENINREFRELISGQENLQTYMQDVKKILLDVRNRVKSDKKVEEKISNNLPENQQNESPNSLLQGFSTLLEKIANWNGKAGHR